MGLVIRKATIRQTSRRVVILIHIWCDIVNANEGIAMVAATFCQCNIGLQLCVLVTFALSPYAPVDLAGRLFGLEHFCVPMEGFAALARRHGCRGNSPPPRN